jgi:hypothetical protein
MGDVTQPAVQIRITRIIPAIFQLIVTTPFPPPEYPGLPGKGRYGKDGCETKKGCDVQPMFHF